MSHAPVDKAKLKELLKEIEKLELVKSAGPMAGILFDIANKFSVMKGETGDTPQKGVDYMTQEEFNQFVKDITKEVKARIRMPEDGKTHVSGQDYPTPAQVEAKINECVAEYVAKIPPAKDGEPGKDADEELIVEKVWKRLDEELPRVAERIRDALKTLEGDERLPIKAIKDLWEELEKLRKSVASVSNTGFVGGGGKGHIKPYDISSQLNGVLKTFTLPANWTVISVVCSSFPSAFRPIIDYTFTPSSITFTSEIDAGSTLATGQTVIVVYEEA